MELLGNQYKTKNNLIKDDLANTVSFKFSVSVYFSYVYGHIPNECTYQGFCTEKQSISPFLL